METIKKRVLHSSRKRDSHSVLVNDCHMRSAVVDQNLIVFWIVVGDGKRFIVHNFAPNFIYDFVGQEVGFQFGDVGGKSRISIFSPLAIGKPRSFDKTMGREVYGRVAVMNISGTIAKKCYNIPVGHISVVKAFKDLECTEHDGPTGRSNGGEDSSIAVGDITRLANDGGIVGQIGGGQDTIVLVYCRSNIDSDFAVV